MGSNSLAHVAGGWPQRLLNTKTMTSFERQRGNVYGGVVEPKYNIVSYTLGRYQVPSGPVINIAGVDWQIPSISQQCFTVEDFGTLLLDGQPCEAIPWSRVGFSLWDAPANEASRGDHDTLRETYTCPLT